MRTVLMLAAAACVLAATPARAQGWADFTSNGDFFTITFPGKPQVAETVYRSEYGADLPAQTYTAADGASRYSLTVANYNLSEPILSEKAKGCPAAADPCGEIERALNGLGYWKLDVRGAITHAAYRVFKRDQVMKGEAKVTGYKWNYVYRTEGQELQLANADGSRSYIGIYMYANRLYIMEATVPAGAPKPDAFLQSIVFLNRRWAPAFHEGLYINGVWIDPEEYR